ncbi:MAG: gliding motility-associated ABC transporter permease subunit GldF [Bacteroidota bacterium]
MMTAIFKKELYSFFNAPIGYLILLLFVLLNGLFLWVFRGSFNIFDYGFADLSNFFLLLPWVFLFLIPAITMRSLSEERKLGTLELLLIKPISKTKIVLGKFLGVVAIGLIALIPTIVYVFAISDLGITPGNYDFGVLLGSYFGTVFLLLLYCSIGIYASSLSDNQIFAFVLGAALCFLIFYGPEAISTLVSDGNTQQHLKNFGAKAHFEDISKGVLDTRNMIYFSSVTAFFLFLAIFRLSHQNASK